jgi:hypothetical protein
MLPQLTISNSQKHTTPGKGSQKAIHIVVDGGRGQAREYCLRCTSPSLFEFSECSIIRCDVLWRKNLTRNKFNLGIENLDMSACLFGKAAHQSMSIMHILSYLVSPTVINSQLLRMLSIR